MVNVGARADQMTLVHRARVGDGDVEANPS